MFLSGRQTEILDIAKAEGRVLGLRCFRRSRGIGMSSVLERLEIYLRNTVRNHEWSALCVSAVYFFCVLASYYTIRPVARVARGGRWAGFVGFS